MDSQQNFVFYLSWLQNIEEEYKDEQIRKDLVYAIVRYGLYGEKKFPCEKLFLKQAFSQIDSAKAIWAARVEAGKKGGSAKGASKARIGNQNASKRKQTQTNTSKTQHNENDNENVNENIHSHDSHSSNQSNDSASLPTLEELELSGVLEKEKKGFYG